MDDDTGFSEKDDIESASNDAHGDEEFYGLDHISGGKEQPSLSEKDFIHESYVKDPTPMWLWALVVMVTVALFWGGMNWYQGYVERNVAASPFSQVSNRDMSLFLWHFPELMRAHARAKNNYLTGFNKTAGAGIDERAAEMIVVGPPELLFRYHHWKRVLGDVVWDVDVPREEFDVFLQELPEWSLDGWEDAPEGYQQVIKGSSDLVKGLPTQVMQAFVGWRNYFMEGESINGIEVTAGSVQQLLKRYPGYARGYWRNVLADTTPDYLEGVAEATPEMVLKGEQLAGFLRQAVHNMDREERI